MKKRKKRGVRQRSRARRVARWLTSLTLGVLLAALLASTAPVLALRWLDPPTTSFILQRRLGIGPGPACSHVLYRWVDWKRISPHAAMAVVTAEDQRFPQHAGLDFSAIWSAVQDRFVSGRRRGASTISQQVAKNLFLWPEKSWLRKGVEVYLTAWIEVLWPKRRILETYLNIAQFGPCVFGVEAASRSFFAKPASALDAREAALLAAVLPNPGRLHADRPSPYVKERAAWVRDQAEMLGGVRYLDGL